MPVPSPSVRAGLKREVWWNPPGPAAVIGRIGHNAIVHRRVAATWGFPGNERLGRAGVSARLFRAVSVLPSVSQKTADVVLFVYVAPGMGAAK